MSWSMRHNTTLGTDTDLQRRSSTTDASITRLLNSLCCLSEFSFFALPRHSQREKLITAFGYNSRPGYYFGLYSYRTLLPFLNWVRNYGPLYGLPSAVPSTWRLHGASHPGVCSPWGFVSHDLNLSLMWENRSDPVPPFLRDDRQYPTAKFSVQINVTFYFTERGAPIFI